MGTRWAPALSVVTITLAVGCALGGADERLTVEEEHAALCGSCHLPPDPTVMPKAIWVENILPNMAARVGYRYGGYDPLAGTGMEEEYHMVLAQAYPEVLQVDTAAWWRVHDYIVSLAPDSIAVDTTRAERHAPLTAFAPRRVSLDANDRAFVTALNYQAATHELIVSDVAGGLFTLPANEPLALRGNGPVVGFQVGLGDTIVTEIGSMQPTQVANGSVYRLRGGGGRPELIADELHRPVFARAVDLDGDGDEEVLVCEFGFYTGALSLLTAGDGDGAAFAKTRLLEVPGTIKFEVADLNGDGHQDIAVIASQGNEGIYFLYGDGALGFEAEQVVQLTPEHGSSWFELFDFEGDGDLDLALANGDNADYSPFLKPYHGLRVFTNDGEQHFEEAYFFPIYGATRVAARDFDGDGDTDLAVSAFFPDLVHNPEEGFVYLERTPGGAAPFRSYTLPAGGDGRWMISEAGDFDGDGDDDVALGSFLLGTGAGGAAILKRWTDAAVDVLLLQNEVARPR